MKPRLAALFLLASMLAFCSACASRFGPDRTGLGYILSTNSKNRVVAAAPADAGTQKSGKPVMPPQRKKVFLTFDDGPDNINTPEILDILDNYGVKATFFVIGTNIEKNPEILKDIIRRGHTVGNHTYTHRYSDVYSRAGGFMESVRANDELIFRITGQRPRIVRDPGGMGNSVTLGKLLAESGYRLVDWNVDSYDSREPYPDGAEIVENIRRQSAKKYLWPGMVVLLHDGKGHINTVRALPTVIEMLLNQGFQFDVLK